MNTLARDFEVRAGTRDDAAGIAALLRSCGGDCITESEAWVRERAHRFRLALDARGRVAATAALLPARGRSLLLRSVAVDPAHRGSGLATRVLQPLLDHPFARRALVWCRTSRPGFFRRLAFRDAGREERPGAPARHMMLRPPVPSPRRHSPESSQEEQMASNAVIVERNHRSNGSGDKPRLWREPRCERRLAICPTSYDEMKIAADIIRSTADWYRPFLDDEDMQQHDIGSGWIEENYDRRDFYLGWKKGDRPVGVLSTQDAGDHLYLGYVYLYESETGHGYGRELLDFARRRAEAEDKDGLVLIAHPQASWATKAYRRFGFERIATRRGDVLAWNGGWLEPYYEQGFELYECRI